MSASDPRVDTPPLNWSDLGVSELPTGTVTLLLADVEGSTGLWETQPEEMTDAVARLDASKLGFSSRIQLAHEAVRH
jgi:class 3 adenylate cyclase